MSQPDVCEAFRILELDERSPLPEIQRQYRKRALHVHPDRSTGNAAAFKQLHAAFVVAMASAEKATHVQNVVEKRMSKLEDEWDRKREDSRAAARAQWIMLQKGSRASTPLVNRFQRNTPLRNIQPPHSTPLKNPPPVRREAALPTPAAPRAPSPSKLRPQQANFVRTTSNDTLRRATPECRSAAPQRPPRFVGDLFGGKQSKYAIPI